MEPPFGVIYKKSPTRRIGLGRFHYSVDPSRDEEWKKETRKTYSSEALWQQEQEIKFDAFAGQLVFPEFQKQYTVIKPYPIPSDATFYMGIDPHPRVPHAFLWMFVDRFGSHVYLRDYWPSRSYGLRGPVPEDDEQYTIDQYAQTILWMEGEVPDLFSANGYTDNGGRRQSQYRRIGDPAAKGWHSNREMGKDEAETFWDRYRKCGINLEEAKKDFQAGRDAVGKNLTPKPYMAPEGERLQSKILIFDTCKELIMQLETNRYPTLTPKQVDVRDPIETPLQKRDHLTDLMRYIEISEPIWIDPQKKPVRTGESIYEEIPGWKV